METGADGKIETLAYPLATPARDELMGLLRTEWSRTDYKWLEAMRGDYSEHLAITSFLARRNGVPAATATIHFARQRPEVAVLGNVMTHRDHRGKGLAGQLVDTALELAKSTGCSVCLLGSARETPNLYSQHGFTRTNGAVMRRQLGPADSQPNYFAPDQPTIIRAAHWGDLPGLTLLAAQPLATACLDYPRGLLSGRFIPATRCLSNFPVLWYDTVARDGLLAVLGDPGSSRIFGFGSVTRGPDSASRHMAMVEFATHDNFETCLSALLAHLLDACRAREIGQVEAFAAAEDAKKLACLHSAGFAEAARLPGALRLGGGPVDVLHLRRLL
jgi:GNAT superfamily N-acetyltransferase